MKLTRLLSNDPNDMNLACNITDHGMICVKCESLQRLLDENQKVTLEFESLTLKYQELQVNYKKAATDAEYTQAKLDVLEKSFDWYNEKPEKLDDCEQLRTEVTMLRMKLERVEREYSELKCDCDEKTEKCGALNKEIENSYAELRELQFKFLKYEHTWQEQQITLATIKTDYEALELKYNELRTAYKAFEQTSEKFTSIFDSLQVKNNELQQEIKTLKKRIQQMQQHLLGGLIQHDASISAMTSVKKELIEDHTELMAIGKDLKPLFAHSQSNIKDSCIYNKTVCQNFTIEQGADLECPERVSSLYQVIEELNTCNAQLSEILSEKLILLKKRDAELAELISLIAVHENKNHQEIIAQPEVNKQLKQKVAELQDLIVAKEAECCELSARVKELMESNTKLKNLALAQEAELRDSRLSNEGLRSECDKLHAQLYKIEGKLQESKSAEHRLEKVKLKLEYELEKVESQLADLIKERVQLNATIENLKIDYIKMEQALHTNIHSLRQHLKKVNDEKSAVEEKFETIKMKMDSLEQQLHESKLHNENLENIMCDYEVIKRQFEIVTVENAALSSNISELQTEICELRHSTKENARRDCDQIEQLQEQLCEAQAKYETADKQRQIHRTEAASLKQHLDEMQNALQSHNREAESQLNELRLKCKSLESTNSKYHIQNVELQQDIALAQLRVSERDSLRLGLGKLETEKYRLESTIELVKNDLQRLQQRLETLDNLHDLKANQKRKVTESTDSPLSSLSHDKKVALQNERRNRRCSTHDERRRQSGALRLSTSDISISSDSSP